jgi:LysM repeat protein
MKSLKAYIQEQNNLPSFLQKKKTSSPEDKPVLEKPKSKVIVMKGNEISVGGQQTNSSVKSTEVVNVPTRQPHQKQLPSPLYKVGENDSVRSIAMKHGLSEREFLEINKGIKDPNKLRPGTQVRTRRGQ